MIVYLNAAQSGDEVTHQTQPNVNFIYWRENKVAKLTCDIDYSDPDATVLPITVCQQNINL